MRPVRLVVGFAAGGTQDVIARLIGQALSERLGQQIVVENRAGASSNIAAEAVIRSPADGYTLFMVGPNNAINASLYDKLSFDFVRDTAPVAGVMSVPNVMEVHPSVPAKSVPEFIAYAKANPGKINMVSGGTGTSVHVAGELFKMMTGVNMVHVPYRGAGPAIADLVAGQVQVMFDNLPSSIGHIRSGNLRALAVTTAKRIAGAAWDPDRCRVRAGLRGERLLRHQRAQVDTACDPRAAQRCDQCRPGRSQDQGTDRRPRRHGAPGLAFRLRQAGRRRNREVGQSCQVLGRQAGLI